MRLSTFPKKNNDPKAKAHYIKYCKVVQKKKKERKKVIKEAKKQHYSRLKAKSNNQEQHVTL